MTAPFPPVASALALLAELDPTAGEPDRIHAVLAWTDVGDRYYEPLAARVPASACGELVHRPERAAAAAASAIQLKLDVDDRPPDGPTSAGRTWCTWSLPSIPPSLRGLDLPALARALADQLTRGGA
jgi:hypothetical protein